MIDLYPKRCNLCGGDVEYISNVKIYGVKRGSGYVYRCKSCGAYVGTHKHYPKKALGILADKDMRKLKIECHRLFDTYWQCLKGGYDRRQHRMYLYQKLAIDMHISFDDCHFGYFDKGQLLHARKVIQGWLLN